MNEEPELTVACIKTWRKLSSVTAKTPEQLSTSPQQIPHVKRYLDLLVRHNFATRVGDGYFSNQVEMQYTA